MEELVAVPAWVWILVVVVLSAFALAAYTFRNRTLPGALYLTAMNVLVGVYSMTYVLTATMVRSADVLILFEHLQLALGTLSVAAWFLFVLTYTGRAELLARRGRVAVAGLLALLVLVDVTGPSHGLVYSEVLVDLSGEVPVVTTESSAVGVFQLLALFSLSPVGLVFLHRTLSEYDQLFSEQALALLLGSVSPYVAAGIDVLQLEPYPAMPLLPLGFGCMSIAVTYAAARHHLFEFVPATRRIGEDRALQQLDEGVVIVSTNGTVLQTNESACRLLNCNRPNCLGEPLECVHDTGADGPTDVPPIIELRGRTLRTSKSSVEGPTGDVTGYVIVYRDVSRKQRREQRITVLNRLLRHNLRNELSVVEGHVSQLADVEDREHRREQIDEIESLLEGIVDLSRKAHSVERHLKMDDCAVERLSVDDLVEQLVERVNRRYPSATIVTRIESEVTIATYREQLEVALENLVENAIEHNDSAKPHVEVAVRTDEDVEFVVSDDGPGIPDHEIEALETDGESQLYHGSGLGLWLVRWLVAVLGGELDFDVSEAGTTVCVRIPTHPNQ